MTPNPTIVPGPTGAASTPDLEQLRERVRRAIDHFLRSKRASAAQGALRGFRR